MQPTIWSTSFRPPFRVHWLIILSLSLLLAWFMESLARTAEPSDPAPQPTVASEPAPIVPWHAALTRLVDGNQRFISGQSKYPHTSVERRLELTTGQKPFATVLGCSDSRVPQEFVFDQGFGDLFVIRVAGNVVDVNISASVEYGVEHLGTNLIVVMGHQSCGAVTAALQARGKPDENEGPGEVVSLLGTIEPALTDVSSELPFAQQVAEGVDANVRRSIQELSRIPDLAEHLDTGKVRIVGAVYELETGRVRFLD